MKAVAIRSYGGPDVLQLIDLPLPDLAPGDLLIRVATCGVNPADLKWRVGMFAGVIPLTFPYIPGYDVAGRVEKGDAVPIGTRVFGMLDHRRAGAYAEFAAVASNAVVPIPEGLDDATAAALPTPALTGVQIIDEHIVPRAGQRVLVTGALGAVGRFALYAAKARGAIVIAAVRDSQRDAALALGANETIVLGETPANALNLDHVVDTVGGVAVAVLCRHLRPGGKIKTAATTPIPPEGLASVPEFIAVHPDNEQLAAIGRAVVAGKVTVPIAHVLLLAEASKAHRLLEDGHAGGKIILRIA